MIYKTNISCGVYELDGIRYKTNPEIIRLMVLETVELKLEKKYGNLTSSQPAHVVFSDNISKTDHEYDCAANSGTELAKFITDNNLGDVVVSPARRNKNSDRMIRVWVWSPNWPRIFKWWKKNNKKVIIDLYGDINF